MSWSSSNMDYGFVSSPSGSPSMSNYSTNSQYLDSTSESSSPSSPHTVSVIWHRLGPVRSAHYALGHERHGLQQFVIIRDVLIQQQSIILLHHATGSYTSRVYRLQHTRRARSKTAADRQHIKLEGQGSSPKHASCKSVAFLCPGYG